MSTTTHTTFTATCSSSPAPSPFHTAECAFERLASGPNSLILDGTQLGEPFPADGAGHQFTDVPGQAWTGVKDLGKSVGDLFSW